MYLKKKSKYSFSWDFICRIDALQYNYCSKYWTYILDALRFLILVAIIERKINAYIPVTLLACNIVLATSLHMASWKG